MSENNENIIKKKILIADDSEMNRELLTDILGDKYDYIYTSDGEETIKVLSENVGVDILLLDMNMPKVSGMQVLKTMRERNWLEEIPVVIISAESDVNFVKNTFYLGATDYIIRPFNAFLVQHRVKNTLMLYSQKKQLVKMVESQVFQREKINNMLITIFSHVIESVNSESGSHTLNVQTITNLLLKKLVTITDKYKLSEEDISIISSVSSLHDIGKITIPDYILNKPGKLTSEEREIMKKHTVNGDEFLKNISIDQNEPLIITAHEICRHHHERYDGKGYPDGLKGDEIPISAQVVSIADVYDALTSERCYKKEFSHEKAVQMILNGECGSFNPLILRAFREVADEVYFNLTVNDGEYDIEENSYILSQEAFANENLSVGERYDDIVQTERTKKEFFADMSYGIQFEYDAVLKNVLYIRYLNENKEEVLLQSELTHLLNEKDWNELNEKINKTTKENPYVEMTVLVPINSNFRWYKLNVRTIWGNHNGSYVGIIGQFTDIHESIIKKCNDFLFDDKNVSGEKILSMCDIFDVVRIVNPRTCETMKVDKKGGIIPTGQKCFEMWNRKEACKNCTSSVALDNKKWMSKLEIKDSLVYSVLSRYVKFEDEELVLEVAFCIDDSFEKSHDEIGFYPDSMALKNYYSDTLTKTYSRAYLESFMPNLENAKGVAIVDIDEFKSINDNYGHIVGDAALKHISKIIKESIRKEDVLIRYGGDEFLLIFDNITEKDFFEKLTEIKEAVHDSVLSEYPKVKHEISIGGAYCVYPFDKAIDVADKAMYKDKFKNKKWGGTNR